VGQSDDLRMAIASQAQADAWFVMDTARFVAERRLIVGSIAASRKPAIYAQRLYAEAGGLMSYAVDLKDLFRLGAVYVDRILRGEQPADLPVQLPNKFEFVVNLKTAKALGLTVPPALLARADEVIE
jgi:ABC-type uncharacterized transport system substrate-binding protein